MTVSDRPWKLPLYIFLGTKAQYVKTMPLLHRLDAEAVPYRLIDSGQHGHFSPRLRRELGLREPDARLSSGGDIKTVREVVWWFLRHTLTALLRPARLRDRLFPDGRGICVIHGDTPSTLLAFILARRAGQQVAHLEAGLRSFNLWKPFPEEIIRIICMRWSDYLFAPSDAAVAALRQMGVRGRIVPTGSNTGREAMHLALERTTATPPVDAPYAVVTVHRVETLLVKSRLTRVIEWVQRLSADRSVVFVLHEPTRRRLESYGLMARLQDNPRVQLLPLQPYPAFVRLLAAAEFVCSDGGSIQEECAYLGIPCLLLRSETERDEGLGDNVRLSGLDEQTMTAFLDDLDNLRRPAMVPDRQPSAIIYAALREAASAAAD